MDHYETARSPFSRLLVWALVATGIYTVISSIFGIVSLLRTLIFFGIVILVLVGIVAVIFVLSRKDR
ncbi:MAG: hypothetical protein N2037_14225 [Acidimicrobiales bacterium]|nr:hypothetical protein [Acidimicrobiales bacterium]